MKEALAALINQVTQDLQISRREGVLLEAALKDAEMRYSALQGRLAALKEICVLYDVQEGSKLEGKDGSSDSTG